MLGIASAEGLEPAIRKYLDTDIVIKRLTAAKRHMSIIAGSIVEAMGAITLLKTVGVEGSSETCGIFAGQHDQNMTKFTSCPATLVSIWTVNGTRVTCRLVLRFRISDEVDRLNCSHSLHTLLNFLCFFETWTTLLMKALCEPCAGRSSLII